MIVLGVDPGTAITGYGAVRLQDGRLQALEYGVIRTDSDQPMTERLLTIHRQLTEFIARLRPNVVAIEQVFFNRNVQSALAVGQARGAAIVAAGQAGLPVRSFSPPEVKLAVCGYGGAQKRQVQEMVSILLGLAEVPKPDDAADALAVAICCLHGDAVRKKMGVLGHDSQANRHG